MPITLGQWEIKTTPLPKPARWDSGRGEGKGEGIVRVKQVHGSNIVWAEQANIDVEADGIAAKREYARPFMISTADCLALVIASELVICALHVSRKTLVRGLLNHVPEFVPPGEMIGTWIGPHICADHFVFERRGEEIAAFGHQFPAAVEKRADGWHLDILAATREYLTGWGLSDSQIYRDGRCTFETLELPSYRRSLRMGNALAGTIATVVYFRS